MYYSNIVVSRRIKIYKKLYQRAQDASASRAPVVVVKPVVVVSFLAAIVVFEPVVALLLLLLLLSLRHCGG